MKYLIISKRSKAVFGIRIITLSIGLKKSVINFPAGGCLIGSLE
jgi:hypothetical protein